MSEEHETLVREAASGQREAVEGLLQLHLPRLRAFVRVRSSHAIRQRESCSDLVQSVCREVLDSLGGFEYRGEMAFRAWLFGKALSKIQQRARFYSAQKRDGAREAGSIGAVEEGAAYARYYSSVITPSRVAMQREVASLVEEAFDQLPDDQREVVSMARIVGLSRSEIAVSLGRSEDSVRGLLERGMARLSWVLSRHQPDED